jgi:hypothetical protein
LLAEIIGVSWLPVATEWSCAGAWPDAGVWPSAGVTVPDENLPTNAPPATAPPANAPPFRSSLRLVRFESINLSFEE